MAAASQVPQAGIFGAGAPGPPEPASHPRGPPPGRRQPARLDRRLRRRHRDVIEKFDFDAQIGRLDRAKLLYLVLLKVTEVDLHPDKVSNVEMGYL